MNAYPLLRRLVVADKIQGLGRVSVHGEPYEAWVILRLV